VRKTIPLPSPPSNIVAHLLLGLIPVGARQAKEGSRRFGMTSLLVALLVLGVFVFASPAMAQETNGWKDSDEGKKLIERADQILSITEGFRGIPVTYPVKKGLMIKDELKAVLLDKLGEEMTDVEINNEAKVLKQLGLMPADLDYKAFMVDLLTEQIPGFYDDDTESLYIMEDQAPALLDAVLSHELFHAIQDQRFGIKALREGGEENGDLMNARVALIEGDALAVMIDFGLHPNGTFTDIPGFEKMIRASMTLTEGLGGEKLESAPLVIREMLTFPYMDGLFFIAALKRKGGWEAVNTVYAAPPSSTEQILHPEKYEVREEPTTVRFTLPAAFVDQRRLVYDNISGELGLYLFLKSHFVEALGGSSDSARATTGWGGDRTLAYESSTGQVTVFIVSDWDSEEDAIEFANAVAEVSAFRTPDAAVRSVNGPSFSGLLREDRTQVWLERRGSEVLYIDGLAPDEAVSLSALRDEIWLTRSLD